MEKKNGSILYFLLGLYTVLINYYYNHSIIDAILTWLFWPLVLIYNMLVGNLSHGMWLHILQSYF